MVEWYPLPLRYAHVIQYRHRHLWDCSRELIAINQDSLGLMGRRVYQHKGFCDGMDVWVKRLSNGDIGVVLWNRGVCGNPQPLNASWSHLGVQGGQKMHVRDIYAQRDHGVHVDSFQGYHFCSRRKAPVGHSISWQRACNHLG